jgi:hypothetical protein
VRLIFVGSIVLSTALSSHAVTLGRHGGAAVIGRPLDIRVEARTGPGEDLSALCIRSEVFFGESQLASSAVQFSPQRTAPDAKASIRIQTTVPVNEPVVSVVVHAGCEATFSRRYVLLADPVFEPATSGEATMGTVRNLGASTSAGTEVPRLAISNTLGNGVSRNSSVQANSRISGAGSAVESGNASGAPASPTTTRSASKAATAQSSVVRKPLAKPVAQGPRLHLDPVDASLAVERDPVLKLSLSLLSEPTTSEQERTAAGLLWKAISASPEAVLLDNQKLAVLEAESKGLREQETKDKAAIKAMQDQIDQSRYITWLAYLLGALLLLSLLGLWFFRRRKVEPEISKRAGAWWDAAPKPAATSAAGLAGAGAGADRRDPTGVDIDFDIGGESSFDGYDSLHGAVAPSGGVRSGDQTTGSRSVATEELFDVQQQADFFVSLGEVDKAIGILKNHLMESQEPSALSYLDLFKLYHMQGNRNDYDALRDDFNHKFNAGAPPFDQYADNSVGLEGYETAFGRIQALWPQPRVLDVIEKSIFRDADDEHGEVFDLEAYRELLLLHAVAKDMIHRAKEGDTPVDFEHTAIRPLKAASSSFAALGTAGGGSPVADPLDSTPMASPRLGLDVDLNELAEMSEFEASLPEVPAVVEPTAVKSERLAKSVADEGNLIDFEVMDFMPPDESDAEPGKDR